MQWAYARFLESLREPKWDCAVNAHGYGIDKIVMTWLLRGGEY